jgi:protein-tyrosine phosphatase
VTSALPRPWGRAWLALAALAALFFLSYGFANWVSGLRHGVPSLAFAWERSIPFLPWTIVPYWSTDFLYAGSLLLCRTRVDLAKLVKRLLSVQAVAVLCFLLFPLQFSFDRPHPAGLFGWMFDALSSFDRPFNQAPSLHVAITTVLWAAYKRRLRGWPWLALRVWFVITALSTLTTWQHHFIDLPTGLWLGLFAICLFPTVPDPPCRDPHRLVLGLRYLAGAALVAVLAFLLRGPAWFLLWPASALSIVAAAYGSGQTAAFHKATGRIAPFYLALLAPYLAGAWLSSRWHTRGRPVAHEIAAGVWLGRLPRPAERDALGIASVVDLTAELPFDPRGVVYRGVPMLDLVAPTPTQLALAVKAIEELSARRPTLVCCALGYSRSALAVAAWLVGTGQAPDSLAAVEQIRRRRPWIVLPPPDLARLQDWESRCWKN